MNINSNVAFSVTGSSTDYSQGLDTSEWQLGYFFSKHQWTLYLCNEEAYLCLTAGTSHCSLAQHSTGPISEVLPPTRPSWLMVRVGYIRKQVVLDRRQGAQNPGVLTKGWRRCKMEGDAKTIVWRSPWKLKTQDHTIHRSHPRVHSQSETTKNETIKSYFHTCGIATIVITATRWE